MGNNKYNKLISEGKAELTAKIKVIEHLNRSNMGLNYNAIDLPVWYPQQQDFLIVY